MVEAAYAVTSDPSPVGVVKLTPQKIATGLRAFFRIAEAWGLTNDQVRVLLGRPARSTFYKWKRGDPSLVPYDTVCRISYVLGIYKALQILFKRPEQADAWVSRPNSAFGGGSALDRMLGGDIADLADVRRCLDAARGRGA